jgi:hypothetical protein
MTKEENYKEFVKQLNELENDFTYMIRRMQISLSNIKWIKEYVKADKEGNAHA